MKDLTASLRALADFLDRDEFEGVPEPYRYTHETGINHTLLVWWVDETKLSLSWFGGGEHQFTVSGSLSRYSLDPTAPQLPQPLLDALEALKS